MKNRLIALGVTFALLLGAITFLSIEQRRQGAKLKEYSAAAAQSGKEASAAIRAIEDREKERAAQPKWRSLHASLRPHPDGRWMIQNDVDHASRGMHAEDIQLVQGPDFLRLYFSKRYKKAGVVQVTTDDGFAGSITANANLGLENATIYLRTYPKVRATDKPMDPARICGVVPCLGNGNLWVSITMLE